ncbi:MAG TPA: diguanylate cyclase [Parasulfuritortus sp.]
MLPLFWLVLSIVGAITFVDTQARRVERVFDDRAIAIGSHFTELEHGVRSVLEGFSAMLEVMKVNDPADRLMVARYASQMREIYPQVYMLELVEKVPRDDLPNFEKRESALLKTSFRIRTFDYGVSRTWLPPDDKADYYVVTFMEPASRSSAQVLGMDIESSQAQAIALRKAIRTGRSAISNPYHIVTGPWAYMMIRPVDMKRGRFAKIVVRTDTFGELFWLRNQRDISVTIHQADFAAGDPRGLLYHHAAQPAGRLESMFLPEFKWRKDLRASGDDPFIIDVSKQMRWSDLDWPVVVGMLLVQVIILLLLLKMAKEHYSHDRERRGHELRLAYLASHDTLTGLPNRTLLLDRMEQAILRAKRSSTRLALLFLDIDHFKAVNDTYGHDAGDRFLMTMADSIKETVRAQDTVARLSGDEFVVLLERMEQREEVDRIARKIKENILGELCTGYGELGVGVSIGVAMYPDNGADAYSLLRHADTQMYKAKKGHIPTTLML